MYNDRCNGRARHCRQRPTDRSPPSEGAIGRASRRMRVPPKWGASLGCVGTTRAPSMAAARGENYLHGTYEIERRNSLRQQSGGRGCMMCAFGPYGYMVCIQYIHILVPTQYTCLPKPRGRLQSSTRRMHPEGPGWSCTKRMYTFPYLPKSGHRGNTRSHRENSFLRIYILYIYICIHNTLYIFDPSGWGGGDCYQPESLPGRPACAKLCLKILEFNIKLLEKRPTII